MDHNSDFRYDLEFGILGEKLIGDILNNKKIEVKTDKMALKTGNLFIEYFSRGKKSGIAVSESSHYVFILSKDVQFIVETNRLKRMCRKYYKTNRDVNGGDSNTSKGILLPLSDLLLKE